MAVKINSNQAAQPAGKTQAVSSMSQDNEKKQKPVPADQEYSLEMVGTQLLTDLNVLASDDTFTVFCNSFLNDIERNVATQREKFYSNDKNMMNIRTSIYSRGIEAFVGNKNYTSLKEIMQRYVVSPFGVFDKLLSENFRSSDIFIAHDNISTSAVNNQLGSSVIQIPPALMPIYHAVVDRFWRLTLYASTLDDTKFDKATGILDYSIGIVRFNVVHKSLNANNDSPIIALRKQVINSSLVSSNYIESLDLSLAQIGFVNDIAYNGSYVIFGETGSGKTTMLKYMSGYRLKEKRNLISIEDTPELGLPVNIAFLTNENYNIQSLFRITLRENPSHVVVGETRSEEIIDILESGLVFRVATTIHADSLSKAIMRIVFMSKKANSEYNTDDLFNLIISVVDGFIYMKNRKVMNIWKRKDGAVAGENVFQAYEEVR
jgi:type IV secretory pathway ATPase VirB11/archaellum biosynthesis ATPase